MKRILTVILLIAIPLLSAIPTAARGAKATVDWDAKSRSWIEVLSSGDVAIRMVPKAGDNVYSIRYKGRELLKQPASLKDLPGFMYGVPVLYPTPNRVRASTFTFGDEKFTFTPNDHGNFLHGLVHSADWEPGDVAGSDDWAQISTSLRFEPGSELYSHFPVRHSLQLGVKVGNDSVRWTYTVDNSKGDKPVPFGFALHPWFMYQGPRRDTFVTIPAIDVMESTKDMLPTGKLLDLARYPEYDARQPRSLDQFYRDDVYFGVAPSHPVVVDFRKPRLKIMLTASENSNHLVLYTPKGQPWFCVEEQTCSTDAHNLYAKGLKKEANLLIAQPGKKLSGWIEMKFTNY